MQSCDGEVCSFGYETMTNPEAGSIRGAYRSFLEVISFIVFFAGVVLNTGILVTLFSVRRTLDNLDVFLMNLILGELVASFGLALVMFYQFSTLAVMGDGGCSFVTWLNVTSVAITVTSLIAIVWALYTKLFYADSRKLNRCKFVACISMTWFVAGLPGIPYISSAKVVNHHYCILSNWSKSKETLYVCIMLVLQIVIPLCILVLLFVRICIALNVSQVEEGDPTITEESTVFSKANYQKSMIKRKVVFVVIVAITFYALLITSSFISLAIGLDVNNIQADPIQYARLRELASVFECLKCILVPLIYICYYDKLRNKFQTACCHDNREYKTLHYSVGDQETRQLMTVV